MEVTVAGHDLAAVAAEGPAGPVADAAAGLLDEERAGAHVPGLELQLPVAVEPAGGGHAQIQRGGAGATHALRPLVEAHELVEVVPRRAAAVVGKSGGE